MTYYLPTYEVKDVNGYSDKQVEKFVEIIKSKAHLIIELAKNMVHQKGQNRGNTDIYIEYKVKPVSAKPDRK